MVVDQYDHFEKNFRLIGALLQVEIWCLKLPPYPPPFSPDDDNDDNDGNDGNDDNDDNK